MNYSLTRRASRVPGRQLPADELSRRSIHGMTARWLHTAGFTLHYITLHYITLHYVA